VSNDIQDGLWCWLKLRMRRGKIRGKLSVTLTNSMTQISEIATTIFETSQIEFSYQMVRIDCMPHVLWAVA